MKNTFFGHDLTTVDTLDVSDLDLIFQKTDRMKNLIAEKGGDDSLKGKIGAFLFFEPSTRTFSSFITAMQRLGGGIIPLNGMENTSVEKGESFEHTVRVFSTYADCLIIRHPEVGYPTKATQVSAVPVVNAGDGPGEHPTQALLDVYTIVRRFPDKKELTVTLAGDLKFGRTVHSLAKLLLKTDKKINFNLVSPEMLAMPYEITVKIKKSSSVFETSKLSETISVSDVIYMTRVQKERFENPAEYEKLKSFYRLDKSLLTRAKKEVIIMHPLPIAAGEISPELDDDSRSLYLREQLQNGLAVRMVLLNLILNP